MKWGKGRRNEMFVWHNVVTDDASEQQRILVVHADAEREDGLRLGQQRRIAAIVVAQQPSTPILEKKSVVLDMVVRLKW
jgi:hypothetical protein